MATPTASYSFTVRLQLDRTPSVFAQVTAVIADAGGEVGAIDIARSTRTAIWRDVTVAAGDSRHAQEIVDRIAEVDGVIVDSVSDRTFLMHIGGKLQIEPRVPLKTRDDLSMAYTPGVGRICTAIASDRDAAWALTIKRHTVAVVSDGSAILGLGDLGPEAAMPVMEGKAVLFKRFADVDAWPICLDTHDVDEIVSVVRAIAPGFGGINLEDIAAPRCFEIERRLRDELDIPVFHDDQHGTAVVVLAALLNTCRLLGRSLADTRVVVLGIGAAGTAVTKILLAAGVTDIIGCDRGGVLCNERASEMSEAHRDYAQRTNPRSVTGTLDDALEGAHVFIGLSGPGAVTSSQIARMADGAAVFAMANPVPEIMPEEVPANVRVMATGRSDYPNQINNVLCFPGIFRGALDVRARRIDADMKIAAAQAIAGVIPEDELSEDYIIPSVFHPDMAKLVARKVSEAARASGAARKQVAAPAPVHLPTPGAS